MLLLPMITILRYCLTRVCGQCDDMNVYCQFLTPDIFIFKIRLFDIMPWDLP